MFDITRYQALLNAVDTAATNQDKGNSFEELCAYLFGCINGVMVEHRNIRMASEEIDIVLWNAQIQEELKPWEFTILVECKNWSAPVDAKFLDNFIAKLRRRCLKTGIFIAANGVTGDFTNGNADEQGAVGIIRLALQEGIRVIVITRDDLNRITCIEDLLNLIRSRYCKLFAHRVL